MKYFIIKILWFVINPLRKSYWFIVRPTTRGVKSIVIYNNKFLLVKLNYAHNLWTFPGGKVNKNESSINAAGREVMEETGIHIRNASLIGSYKSNKDYKNDTVEVYTGTTNSDICRIDPIEIRDARWFERNNIPQDRASSVNTILDFYDEFIIKNGNIQ